MARLIDGKGKYSLFTRNFFTRTYMPHPLQIDSNLLAVITAFTTTSCIVTEEVSGYLASSGRDRGKKKRKKERERERQGLKPSVQNGSCASFIRVSRSFRRRVVCYSRPLARSLSSRQRLSGRRFAGTSERLWRATATRPSLPFLSRIPITRFCFWRYFRSGSVRLPIWRARTITARHFKRRQSCNIIASTVSIARGTRADIVIPITR